MKTVNHERQVKFTLEKKKIEIEIAKKNLKKIKPTLYMPEKYPFYRQFYFNRINLADGLRCQ